MSSTFVVMGLLVLAGFALGLLVGWLAWASDRAERDDRGGPVVGLRPMTRGLPDWEIECGQDDVQWTAVDPAADDPTVVIGRRTTGHTSDPDQS